MTRNKHKSYNILFDQFVIEMLIKWIIWFILDDDDDDFQIYVVPKLFERACPISFATHCMYAEMGGIKSVYASGRDMLRRAS